jgi:hypothetical protein
VSPDHGNLDLFEAFVFAHGVHRQHHEVEGNLRVGADFGVKDRPMPIESMRVSST